MEMWVTPVQGCRDGAGSQRGEWSWLRGLGSWAAPAGAQQGCVVGDGGPELTAGGQKLEIVLRRPLSWTGPGLFAD